MSLGATEHGIPFTHYGEAVWDTVRMNDVAQHVATAFFDRYLNGDEVRGPAVE